MALNLAAIEGGDVLIIKLKGELDTYTSRDFLEFFQRQLERGKNRFVVDMSDVSFVSSSGWGALSSAYKRSREKGGSLVLYGLRGQVKRVYRIMGFRVILKAYDDIREAIQQALKRV
ncbi:MAG: STAS domain-containing protein [Thermotogae bacterium]|nr:STAS domain-containing protein [Thermotogota bacterium]